MSWECKAKRLNLPNVTPPQEIRPYWVGCYLPSLALFRGGRVAKGRYPYIPVTVVSWLLKGVPPSTSFSRKIPNISASYAPFRVWIASSSPRLSRLFSRVWQVWSVDVTGHFKAHKLNPRSAKKSCPRKLGAYGTFTIQVPASVTNESWFSKSTIATLGLYALGGRWREHESCLSFTTRKRPISPQHDCRRCWWMWCLCWWMLSCWWML